MLPYVFVEITDPRVHWKIGMNPAWRQRIAFGDIYFAVRSSGKT